MAGGGIVRHYGCGGVVRGYSHGGIVNCDADMEKYQNMGGDYDDDD